MLAARGDPSCRGVKKLGFPIGPYPVGFLALLKSRDARNTDTPSYLTELDASAFDLAHHGAARGTVAPHGN